jgi:hypothetical protein
MDIYRWFGVLAKASEEQEYGRSVHKLSDVEPLKWMACSHIIHATVYSHNIFHFLALMKRVDMSETKLYTLNSLWSEVRLNRISVV